VRDASAENLLQCFLFCFPLLTYTKKTQSEPLMAVALLYIVWPLLNLLIGFLLVFLPQICASIKFIKERNIKTILLATNLALQDFGSAKTSLML